MSMTFIELCRNRLIGKIENGEFAHFSIEFEKFIPYSLELLLGSINNTVRYNNEEN